MPKAHCMVAHYLFLPVAESENKITTNGWETCKAFHGYNYWEGQSVCTRFCTRRNIEEGTIFTQ